MAGFIAPAVAEAIAADQIVLLAAMIPTTGERGHDWWTNTGHETAQRRSFDELDLDPADLDNPDALTGPGVETLLQRLDPRK